VADLLDVNVLVAIVVPEHEHHDLLGGAGRTAMSGSATWAAFEALSKVGHELRVVRVRSERHPLIV
jgi:hypothetical protein